MVEIQKLLLDLPALAATEGLQEIFPHVGENVLLGLGLHLRIGAEFEPAALALRDGVVGVVVGKREGCGIGSTVEALKRNADVVSIV